MESQLATCIWNRWAICDPQALGIGVIFQIISWAMTQLVTILPQLIMQVLVVGGDFLDDSCVFESI